MLVFGAEKGVQGYRDRWRPALKRQRLLEIVVFEGAGNAPNRHRASIHRPV
jgi:hypothetical protein